MTVSGFLYQNEIRQAWSNAARRKDEADRKQRERIELARKAEEECEKQRSEEIDRAKGAHAATRKRVSDCRAAYAKQILPFETSDQYCKLPLGKLRSAKDRLDVASLKTCSTASTSK